MTLTEYITIELYSHRYPTSPSNRVNSKIATRQRSGKFVSDTYISVVVSSENLQESDV